MTTKQLLQYTITPPPTKTSDDQTSDNDSNIVYLTLKSAQSALDRLTKELPPDSDSPYTITSTNFTDLVVGQRYHTQSVTDSGLPTATPGFIRKFYFTPEGVFTGLIKNSLITQPSPQ